MPIFGRALIVACLLLGCPGFSMDQPAPSYIIDPAPHGLPQSSVIALAQTPDGYLWIGTRDGLARFDGNHYEVFNRWNTPGLNSSTIVRLFADSGGGLWVGTAAGATFIKDGLVTNLDLAGGGAVAAFCEDATGAVWIYTKIGWLARVRDGKVESIWPAFRPSVTRTMIAESSGRIWIGTDGELFNVASDVRAPGFELLLRTNALPGRLDYLQASRNGGYWEFAGGRVLKMETNRVSRDLGPYPWGSARIMAAIEDHEGNLVVGTQNSGVFKFDGAGRSHPIAGLSQNTALSLCEDREGNLWVGTDGGGLNRVRRNPFSVAEPWAGYVVQSICEDTNGGLWFGFNGAGATYWKGDAWQNYGPAEGLFGSGADDQPNFSTVLVDREQRVWVGTRDYGLYQIAGDRFQLVRDARLVGRNVSVLHEDRAGRIWVGTDAGLACLVNQEWRWFNTQSNLTANEITAVADDADGDVWIGTAGNGLNRWRDGKVTAYHEKDGLPCENITSLCVDRDGVLWVGTGNGLGRFHDGRWYHYSSRDGLAADSIGYLIEDPQGNLWIGSNLGLTRVTKDSSARLAAGKSPVISCRVFNKEDGLPTSECTQGSQPAACRTADGRMWFPTIRGLVTFDPGRLLPNTNPPPVAIESVLLDEKEQSTNRLSTTGLMALTIPASAERLEIFFTSLNLAAPEQARFQYWMEGHEATRPTPTDSRSATYTKLPAGDYRFHVIACNEDGVWNRRGASLSIKVLPPFWRTWWFISGAVLCVLGAVAGTVYFISTQRLQQQLAQMRQQEALEKERSRIARDLHDQLGANLTQVALLGEMAEEDKNSPDEITSHAKQISQTARETSHALDEIVWAANPQNDTLEGLVNYACKYAQDYLALAGLRYRLDIPSELPATTIPPDLRHNVFLAFKESVNNVVKHAQAGEVWIRLRMNGRDFVLEIEDDGRGPGEAATKTGRNGLRNMRKRMEDVGGNFSMEPGTKHGTIVRLTSPIGKR